MQKAMQLANGLEHRVPHYTPGSPPSPTSVRHMSMHIYELALSTLLMGFDADADARFFFPRLASVLTVQEGD